MQVGLIGAPERAELQRLAIRLEERGAEAVHLDPRGEPRIELGPGREEACGVQLSKLRAVYVADLALAGPERGASEGEGDAGSSARCLRASQMRLLLWNTLLERLALRCRVVNPPTTHALHGLKPYEMAVYRGLGLAAPRTVATNSPSALLELPGDVASWITKGMVGGYGYTEPFAPPSTSEEAEACLARGPLMVQERIEGENVRAFVVDGAFLGAAEVISADADEVDSRRQTLRLRKVDLPEEARRAAVTATTHWGLSFSAVDLMREAVRGRYQLLECNSAPFFVEFERSTGIDIASALADCLTERRRAPAR